MFLPKREKDQNMSYLILFSIQLYRKFIKPKYVRTCIFKESCSNFVERVTNEKGGLAGLRALWERLHHCRPGYTFYFKDSENQWQLISAGGKRYERSLLSPSVVLEGDMLQKRILSVKHDYPPRLFESNSFLVQPTFKNGGIRYVSNSHRQGDLRQNRKKL